MFAQSGIQLWAMHIYFLIQHLFFRRKESSGLEICDMMFGQSGVQPWAIDIPRRPDCLGLTLYLDTSPMRAV